MLAVKSISSQSNVRRAAAYYENYQCGAENPKAKVHDEPPGVWYGDLASKMGLHDAQVQKGHLLNALQGYHPQDKSIQMSKNAGHDRHKPGYDLVFNAPKSVSLLWAIADDGLRDAISAAHMNAVRKAIDYAVESGAFVQRRGHGGILKEKYTEVAFALFEHSSSRAGEAHLHVHAVVPNISGNGKRIEFDANYAHAIGAAYRAELAHSLAEMGFAIERDRFSFRLRDIPHDLEREMSSRAEQIKDMAARKVNTPAAKNTYAVETRAAKPSNPREIVFNTARELAQQYKIEAKNLRTNSHTHASHRAHQGVWNAILTDAFESASTLSTPQIERAFFEVAQITGGGIEFARRKLSEMVRSGDLIILDNNGKPRWTTKETLRIEQELAEYARRAASVPAKAAVRLDGLRQVRSEFSLTVEQKRALAHICDNKRNIAIVEGIAGAGKSYLLQSAKELFERHQCTVIGMALSGKAASELAQSSGIRSETIHRTLRDIEDGRVALTPQTVLVVDEAGMVGSRLMYQVVQHVEKTGAKLVLVGDTKQLQPIEAGGAMRAMMLFARQHASLNNVRRQKDPQDRQIVMDIKELRISKALKAMADRGYLREHPDYNAAIREIAELVVRDLETGKTSIALVARQVDTRAINKMARTIAKERGLLQGEDYSYTVQDKGTQKRESKQFAIGDRVISLRNNRELNIKNGQTWTVVKAEDEQLTLRQDKTEREIVISSRKYPYIEHAYAITIHKAQGVTVDRSHVLHNSRMSDHSLGYVSVSRHRDSMTYHYTSDQANQIQKDLSRQRYKDSSSEYLRLGAEGIKRLSHDIDELVQIRGSHYQRQKGEHKHKGQDKGKNRDIGLML